MALGDADAGGDCSAVQAIFSMPGVKRWMSSISMFTLNQRMGRCRVFRWVVIWIMIFEHFDMYGNNEPIVSDVGSNWMYFYTLQIYGWNISFLQQKISRFYPMIRLEHLELIADRISSMVWWKLLREDLRLPRWEGMAKLSLGVTAVGVEIATKSLTSCGLPKLRSKKSGGGWCVMVLWRFGWLVGLWDAFMTCYLWEKKLSKSCLFDVKDSNGQCQALLWPRLSFPVIFNVVSFMHPSILWQRVPTTLSRLRTFICKRATCATTRGQSWALPEKCIFGYLLNKDARHIYNCRR